MMFCPLLCLSGWWRMRSSWLQSRRSRASCFLSFSEVFSIFFNVFVIVAFVSKWRPTCPTLSAPEKIYYSTSVAVSGPVVSPVTHSSRGRIRKRRWIRAPASRFSSARSTLNYFLKQNRFRNRFFLQLCYATLLVIILAFFYMNWHEPNLSIFDYILPKFHTSV